MSDIADNSDMDNGTRLEFRKCPRGKKGDKHSFRADDDVQRLLDAAFKHFPNASLVINAGLRAGLAKFKAKQ
jgi:hypothetical protein